MWRLGTLESDWASFSSLTLTSCVTLENYLTSPSLSAFIVNGIIMAWGLRYRLKDVIILKVLCAVWGRENTNESSYKEDSACLAAEAPFHSLPIIRAHTVPGPERLLSTPSGMGLKWWSKGICTRSCQEVQRSRANTSREGEADRKKPASRWPLPTLSSLLWHFSHYLIPVLLYATSGERE